MIYNVRKNNNTVLVTIFDKLQNLKKYFLLKRSKVVITGSILNIF